MIATKNDVWTLRADDGQSRSHVPPFPVWVGILRGAQLFVAVLIMILTAVAAAGFGTGNIPGFNMAWFSFVWTLAYFIWLLVAVVFQPSVYHYWAHLAVEGLTCVWWLVSFSLLASEASALADLESYTGFIFYITYNITGRTRVAIDCTKAAAGIGALEWILFVTSLIFLTISILNHRKTEAAAAPAPAAQTAPVQQVAQQQPVQQPQAVYHQQPGVYQQQQPQPAYAQQAPSPQAYQTPPPQAAYQQPPPQQYQVAPGTEPHHQYPPQQPAPGPQQ